MKISDLKQEEIVVGLRIRSLKDPLKFGTIVKIDVDDCYAWIQWDGESELRSGFYWNDCKCEVIL